MKRTFSTDTVNQLLDKIYLISIEGTVGLDKATELAEKFKYKCDSIDMAVESLIKSEVSKCSKSGFLTSIGGILTLPLGIPINFGSVLTLQMRMVLAIAHLKGFDIYNPKVKNLVYLCLCGKGAREVLASIGLKLTNRLRVEILNKASQRMLTEMSKRITQNLAIRLTSRGLTVLGRAVPIASGFVGATYDTITTKSVASTALQIFNNDDINLESTA